MFTYRPITQALRQLLTLGFALAMLGTDFGAARVKHATASGSEPLDPIKAQLSATYSKLPLSFEVNRGQAAEPVKFLAQSAGYRLFLTADGAALALYGSGVKADRAPVNVLRMQLLDANPQPCLEPLDELPGKSNYLIGNDPTQWRANVANYARVKYHEVYPGIDLLYYGQQGQLEYDFVLRPGANPRLIKLAFAGAKQMRIDANGDLVLRTSVGEVRQHKPVVYQEVDGVKRFIAGRYVRQGKREIGFAVGEYDASQPLVIDPVLSYASYLGGSAFEHGNAIAVDAAGNIYVAGGTGSANFSTTSAAQASFGGTFDGFIAKLNPNGSSLIYATYFGGSGGDSCFAMTVDATSNVYLTGITASPNFPTTAGAPQRSYGGGQFDAYAAKLNAEGVLIYATYLGGSGTEQGHGITVDANGAAHVAGLTASTNFPTKNALQQTYGGSTDAFVTKVEPDGSGLVYSTYLGGSALEQGCGIAVDAGGNTYVSGWTRSTNFPVANALQPASAGGGDIFISKLNPSGTELVYSTYLGGSTDDAQGLPSNQLALDAEGNVYLIGATSSRNFPLANPLQATHGGGTMDAFVTKLNAQGTALVFSTYLGGSGNEILTSDGIVVGDIAVDAAGQVYVTGTTVSTNFPTANAVQASSGGGYDAFVAKLNASGSALIYSTYFGGSNNDDAACIALDPLGGAYVSGRTLSTNFQMVNAVQPTLSGNYDAFFFKLGADAVTVSAASFSGASIASKAIVAAFGPNLATATASASTLPLPTTLAGTTVRIRDSVGVERAAPLFFVSANQINYQIPDGTVAGPAAVTVTSGDGRISSTVIQVASAAPSIFTANASGSGAAAALDAITFTVPPFNATQANGQPNIIAVFGTGLGADATDVDGDVSAQMQATLDGNPVRVLYAGRVPGLVGLNQFNVQLPAGSATGVHTLVVTRNGRASNPVTLAIR